jgi:hypothetical protein
MAFARAKLHDRGRREQVIDGPPRFVGTRRLGEDPPIGHDAHEARKNDLEQTERLVVVGEPLEQWSIR